MDITGRRSGDKWQEMIDRKFSSNFKVGDAVSFKSVAEILGSLTCPEGTQFVTSVTVVSHPYEGMQRVSTTNYDDSIHGSWLDPVEPHGSWKEITTHTGHIDLDSALDSA